MHYARLDKSARLQRLLSFLADGQEHTTMDIIRQASICAVNSAVSELRRNGHAVNCRPLGMSDDGARVYGYRLQPKI